MSEMYLVLSEIKEIIPLQTDHLLELIVKEWETINEYQTEGKIVVGGAMAGRKGGCGIWKVDSIEELHVLLSRLPLFFYIDTQIIPLTSSEYALELCRQALSSIPPEPKTSM